MARPICKPERMTAPAPGWYADPQQPGHLRWWDGGGWSDHRQPDPVGAPLAGYAHSPIVPAPSYAQKPGFDPASSFAPSPAPTPADGVAGIAPAVPADPIAHSAAQVVGCQLCGRGPAAEVAFWQGTGMLVLRTQRHWKGRMCRPCGMAIGKKAMAHTVLLGWWGIISFFTNFGFIGINAASFLKLRKLSQPA